MTLIPNQNNLSLRQPWVFKTTGRFERDRAHYNKKHPRELAACLRNTLLRYLPMLNAALNPRAIHAGFLHPEPGGVMAVDQKGGGGNLRETRLYTYAQADTRTLHLLLLGDKATQRRDLVELRKLLSEIIPPPTHHG